MPQLIELTRILVDQAIPPDRNTRYPDPMTTVEIVNCFVLYLLPGSRGSSRAGRPATSGLARLRVSSNLMSHPIETAAILKVMPKHRHSDATITAPPDTPSDRASEADAARMLVSRRILILANVLKRAAGLRYRRLLDLAPGEWGLIAEVGIQAPQSLNALSNNLGLDKTQLSKSVSRLVARGLLSRRIKPDNNREVLISLTANGELYFQKIVEAGRAVNDALLSELPARERQRFIAAIDDMTAQARALLQVEQRLGAVMDDPSGDGETLVPRA